MKKVIFVLIFTLFAILSPARTHTANAQTNTRIISPNETVEHLFTHCLISHPEIAFADGNDYGKHLNNDCLTANEFRAVLQQLYERNYALVDVESTYVLEENRAKRVAFEFFADKKPLVLSFDDVVYARKNQGKGLCDKLELDQNGEIVAYTDAPTPRTHKEEFVPILEDFIAKHPNFSYKNARGIIFLTGFDGILGYRTARIFAEKRSETERAKTVVAALKEKGWKFGCHSYAHGHMRTYTDEQMKMDAQKWQNEVQPLVGKTALYAYPYGEWTMNGSKPKILKDFGFHVFFGVGERPFYTQMATQEGEKVLFQDRCPMDGTTLRSGYCDRFFNAKEFYDSRRPLPLP